MAAEVERYFSVEEANGAVSDVRARLERIREARRTLLDKAEVVGRRAAANGGGTEGTEVLEALRTLRADVEWFAREGIVLRDADTGLIDFPSRREGRLVYLCWREDEDRVTHWHEVDTGFPGRKPL